MVIQNLNKRLGPGIPPSLFRLAAIEEYETTFGIFNHDGDTTGRPLASQAMHAKENYGVYSKLHRSIWRYHLLKLKDITGLDVYEFLSKPREYVELMYRIAETMATKATSEVNDVLNGMKE